MCRMFAVIAEQPRSCADLLVQGENCLLKQSCGDHRGEKHHDGWGIGWYEHEMPRLVRSPGRASDEPLFSETALNVQSTLLMGHVRQASVGQLSVDNCHPFVWDRWMLAHNGTIEGFDHVAPRMQAEMSSQWLDLRRGTTDSELLFLWLLSRGQRAGIDWQTTNVNRPRVNELLRQGIADLVAWTDEAPPRPDNKPTRLNLLFTNGQTLWVTRWQYDLHYCERPGMVIVASEPIDEGPWRELPEPSILTVRCGEPVVVEAMMA
jgi:predicted glutamine amidotransferase